MVGVTQLNYPCFQRTVIHNEKKPWHGLQSNGKEMLLLNTYHYDRVHRENGLNKWYEVRP